MGKNGHNQGPDVLVGDAARQESEGYGNPLEHWQKDWKNAPAKDTITQLYHMPGTDDLAGILLRGNFTNQEQADALALLAAFADEEKDEFTMKLCRLVTSATVGVRGSGRLEALFGGIGIVASRMWEITKGIGGKRNKKDPDGEVYRRSDFRQEGPPQTNGNSY